MFPPEKQNNLLEKVVLPSLTRGCRCWRRRRRRRRAHHGDGTERYALARESVPPLVPLVRKRTHVQCAYRTLPLCIFTVAQMQNFLAKQLKTGKNDEAETAAPALCSRPRPRHDISAIHSQSPHTLRPALKAPYPTPCTPISTIYIYTLHLKSYARNHSSTLRASPYNLNPQPSTLNPHSSSLNPTPSARTLHHTPLTANLQKTPYPLIPKS